MEAVGADPPLVKYCTLRAKEGPQSACQRKPLHCAVHREDHPEVTLWRVQSAYAVQLRNPVEGDRDSGAKPIRIPAASRSSNIRTYFSGGSLSDLPPDIGHSGSVSTCSFPPFSRIEFLRIVFSSEHSSVYPLVNVRGFSCSYRPAVCRWNQVAPKSVDGARRFRRHDSRLTAIWTFHRHGSLLRDQDRAPFGGQLWASTPNCLAYEAGAEALSLWEEIWPGRAMKLVGPLAARSPGLRLALAHEIERHGSADEILQGRRIDLVAFVEVDGAPGIPLEAGVE